MKAFRNGVTCNQLIIFNRIYEAGKISEASKQLGISSASISNSLKTLEKLIGQPLFIRTTRAMTPTEIGNKLYETTCNPLNELFSAVDLICDLNDVPSGKLSINIASSIYQVFLKDVLKDFQRAYPHIELDISLSDTIDNRIEHGIDIGFRYGERVDDMLIARPINPFISIAKFKKNKSNNHTGNDTVKAGLFVSKKYAQRHGVPQNISELSHHAQVKFRMPSSQNLAPLRLHRTADPSSEILTIDTPTAMVVNDLDVLVDMVADGFGMGMMLDIVWHERFTNGELVPVLEPLWCDIPTIYMYYARESKQSLKVRCFLEFVQQSRSG